MYRSQYLVPVVVAACHELGIGNLYLKRTQVCLLIFCKKLLSSYHWCNLTCSVLVAFMVVFQEWSPRAINHL